jgi:spore coat protein A
VLAVPAAHRTLRIAPTERFDAIVDFARFAVGTEITLLNRAATGPAGQVMRFHVTTEIWIINGKPFDPKRIGAQPRLNTTEIWRLRTDFSHPLHLHLVHFRVLSHSGRPGPWDAGYKDTIDLAPGEVANILVKFTGYRGRYVFHCHNLEHEDMAMIANFEVV